MSKKKQVTVWMCLGLIFFFTLSFFIFSIFPSSLTNLFKKPSSSESIHRLNRIKSLTRNPIHWTVLDIDGKTVSIKKGFNSIVINLWATWCPPCIEELPSLSELAQSMGHEGLVVAVSTEPLEKVRRFIKTSFPDLSSHLKIVSVTKEEQSRFFPPDNLPVTYIFNREGLLVEKVVGARDWKTFKVPER